MADLSKLHVGYQMHHYIVCRAMVTELLVADPMCANQA
jgi:hypothetical protein